MPEEPVPVPVLKFRMRARPVSLVCSEGHVVPTDVVPDAWFEVPLDDAWIAAYRLVQVDDEIVTAEVRVFPYERGRDNGGEWSAERLGARAPVPRGGLPARTLRNVKIDTHLRAAADQLGALRKKLGMETTAMILSNRGFAGDVEHPRRGRPGPEPTSDLFYARLAAEYVRLVKGKGSRRPVRELYEWLRVQHLHYNESSVTGLLDKARNRGLLTRPPKRGTPGGDLTPYARELLAEHEPHEPIQRPGPPTTTKSRRKR
jgi:hypothetical protein